MGTPKAWLELDQQPILQWLLARLKWAGPTMLVSAPSVIHPPGCGLFDREVTDPVDGSGPLQGIMTALTNLATPTAVAITVDMPGVTPSFLTWLARSLEAKPGCHGIMCSIVEHDERHIQPFPSIFRLAARGDIAKRLERGQLSVQRLCMEPGFAVIEPPADLPPEVWINLNSPVDLAEFNASHHFPNRKNTQ